jgi:sialic acid synthase SpsE
MSSELSNKTLMQKSLVALHNIESGEIIKREDLTCKRPASGLSPVWEDRVIGKRAAKNIPKDSILDLSHIDW